ATRTADRASLPPRAAAIAGNRRWCPAIAGACSLSGDTGGAAGGAAGRRPRTAMTIVRSTYRYKPPPKKRKPVALEVPAIVTIRDKKRYQRADATTGDPVVAQSAVPPPERKSAIVTSRAVRSTPACPT